MRPKHLITTIMLSVALFAFSQPKSEVRAVWLTTNVDAMDWPKTAMTEKEQKESLCTILDKLFAANFNTILFQVQVHGDVMWDSGIQPAMANITGDGSKGLSYNICDFVIEECHKRNMECHAWIVPYRIGKKEYAKRYANNKIKHVTVTHPELCVEYGGQIYLDPGWPETTEYLLGLYREMLTKHKFDGTNFDYTRYPHKDFDDSASAEAAGLSLGNDRSDWRRANINNFVHKFYDMVKEINPDIKVGSAPIGTYINLPGLGGNQSAYSDVFQDACEWMQSGKQDIIFPQMYWDESANFSRHMTTWVDSVDNRQIAVGLAPYKMYEGPNWNYKVVTDLIEKVRAKKGMYGICFFRTDHITDISRPKTEQLYNAIKNNYFKYPANIIPMKYNGVTKPNMPVDATSRYEKGIYTIRWTAPESSPDNTAIKYYCVYASESASVNIADIKNCVGFYIKGTEFSYTSDKAGLNFIVTAFDKNYYESDGAIVKTSGVESNLTNSISFNFKGNEIIIKAGNEINEIILYSGSGTIIKNIRVDSTEANVTCDGLSNGIYIVRVKYDNGTFSSHKIII